MSRLTVRPGGYEVDTGRSHPLVPVTATLAALSFGAVAFFGSGGFAALGSGVRTASSPAGSPEAPGAPNTPTIDVTIQDTSTWWVDFSTFVGSGSDTQDSISVTVLRTATTDTLFHAVSGVQVRDTVISNDSLSADSVYEVFGRQKGADGGWSAYDSVQVTNTIAVPGGFDPFLPPQWTDTVHYYTFADTSATDISSDTEQTVAGWTVFNDNGSTCHGARLSNFTPACQLADTFTVANQPSPGWWEAFYDTNAAGALLMTLPMSNGNGPAAASSLTRVYIRWSMLWEADGVGLGANDWQFMDQSQKWFSFNDISNVFEVWDGSVAWVNAGSSANGCENIYANTWVEYFPDDTANLWSGCPQRGAGYYRRGIIQHYFVCFDMSPSSGSRIFSFGTTDANGLEGIAGYHSNITTIEGSNTFNSLIWNGTYGGTPKTHPQQSAWFNEVLIMTGSSGSCIDPNA